MTNSISSRDLETGIPDGLEYAGYDQHLYAAQPELEVSNSVRWGYEITGATKLFAPVAPQTPSSRNPFNLSAFAFASLVAMITVVIVGLGVGGGLGVSLASCRMESIARLEVPATSISTNTLSNFTVTPAQNISSIFVNCPDIDRSQYTALKEVNALDGTLDIYEIRCGMGIPAGSSTQNGTLIADIAGFLAYNHEHCIEACSNYNFLAKKNGRVPECRAVAFTRDLKQQTAEGIFSNCWLKNGTLAPGSMGRLDNGAVSAIRLNSSLSGA